jgi:hypothetical protein
MAACVDQRDRRLVPVLGLAADVAHGLVQQDGDALGLRGVGAAVHGDLVLRRHLQPHHGHLAVHAHPAALDPFVGLAARAQAQLGQALVQPHGAGAALRCGAATRGSRRAPPAGVVDGESGMSRLLF